MRICFWLVGAAGCLLFLPVAGAQGIDESEARAVLERQFRLRRLKSSSEVWITPREQRLRRRLEELRATVERINALSGDVANASQQHRIKWALREPALRKRIQELPSSDSKRKKLERLLKEGDADSAPPHKLAGLPLVQALLIELTNHRHRILLDVWAVRRDVAALESEYEMLGKNEQAATALARLGDGHRLGPLKSYAGELQALTEYEQAVYQRPQPLYLQSGKIRVGAILNEGAPITFTWRDGEAPTVITAGAAQAAGLIPPDDAPMVRLTIEKNRPLTARRITLASIRIGGHVLRDVEAHVLPPEGEDLGAQISKTAFAGLRVVADPASLVFRIESESAAEPAPPEPSQSRR